MKKSKIKMLTLVMMVALMIIVCFAASATEAYFSNAKLYPTQYSVVKGANKTNSGTYATLSLETISAITGSSYSKSYVYVKVGAGGTAVKAYANNSVNLTLTGGYQTAGVYVPLYGMSADSSHNCLITGYWNVH